MPITPSLLLTVLGTAAAVLFLFLAFRFLFRKKPKTESAEIMQAVNLPAANLPKVNLPKFNLPEFTLPSIELPSIDLFTTDKPAKALAPVRDGAVSAPSLEDSFRKHGLSEREMEIAVLMVREGLENKEVGKRLGIAQTAVNNHIDSIFRKFNAKNRIEFMTHFVRER